MVLRLTTKYERQNMSKQKATKAAAAFIRQLGRLGISAKIFKHSVEQATNLQFNLFEASRLGDGALPPDAIRMMNTICEIEMALNQQIDQLLKAFYNTPMQLSSEC